MSSAPPERRQKTIDDIVAMNKIANAPKSGNIYDPKYLPPAAERTIKN